MIAGEYPTRKKFEKNEARVYELDEDHEEGPSSNRDWRLSVEMLSIPKWFLMKMYKNKFMDISGFKYSNPVKLEWFMDEPVLKKGIMQLLVAPFNNYN